MDKIIKEIKNIMGDFDSSVLTINFYKNEIVFLIYETEVPIIFNGKKIYLDCEFSKHHLTYDMLQELADICKLLEDNRELLKNFL